MTKGNRQGEGGSVQDERGEANRIAILDATIRCFAEQGWAGTNMSLIARATGMTRGKIQYYYPVLDDLKFAAIDHLSRSWQVTYFEAIEAIAGTQERFEKGVDLLWQLAHEPLQVARRELEAAARTDAALRRALDACAVEEEALSLDQTARAFPAIAALGEEQLQLGRYFALVFLEGLASHRFPSRGDAWRTRLIAMFKYCLATYWAHLGVDVSGNSANPAPPPSISPPAADPSKLRALKLLQEAADLLADANLE